MNKRQLEVQRANADEEAKIIGRLKSIYGQAQDDCVNKIIDLSRRKDMENLQSIIWQKRYQEALKKQIDGIMNNLDSSSFAAISDYLEISYDNGFFGTLYDLQGQGIPLCFPINQEQVVQSAQVNSKISEGLYKKLGEDTDKLKKSIRTELSRGAANGESWDLIASHIALGMTSPFKKAYNKSLRIARTEGHRVQQEATLHCQQKAKAKGADVMKQWDSTLDGATRPNHVTLDGVLKEVEQSFEVDGKSARYPGGFGDPSEDCNCRCCLLPRAKWALSEEEYITKWDGDTNELVKIKSEDYNNFKSQVNGVFRSREYRIVNYEKGNYAIPDRITFLEAISDMPKKVKEALKDTAISVGSSGSAFDSLSNTIYVGKNASKTEIIHEIGHAIENKLFDKKKVKFLKELCVEGLTVDDIVVRKAVDSSGNEAKVFIVKSDKLIDTYQGRLYVETSKQAIHRNGTIDVKYMGEFVSMAVQKYYEDATKLKKNYYDIFALVEGALK